MTDEKHKLKRSPTLSISSVPKPKEKKIPLPEMDTSEEEKEFKGLPGPAPTVSAGYIQTLVLHPATERDPDRTGRHYAPCPPPTTTDISKDHAINEWVLNHLPLTEPQKQELIQNMNIERRKNEMLSESLTMRSKNLKALKEKETEKIRLEEEKERGTPSWREGTPDHEELLFLPLLIIPTDAFPQHLSPLRDRLWSLACWCKETQDYRHVCFSLRPKLVPRRRKRSRVTRRRSTKRDLCDAASIQTKKRHGLRLLQPTTKLT